MLTQTDFHTFQSQIEERFRKLEKTKSKENEPTLDYLKHETAIQLIIQDVVAHKTAVKTQFSDLSKEIADLKKENIDFNTENRILKIGFAVSLLVACSAAFWAYKKS